MMVKALNYAFSLYFSVAMYGCSSSVNDLPLVNTVSIDKDNPKRIHFIVQGDPGLARYPEIEKLPLPMHEKIIEGMRRYAADELHVRNWCTGGFSGPKRVWAYESTRLTRQFFVDCF